MGSRFGAFLAVKHPVTMQSVREVLARVAAVNRGDAAKGIALDGDPHEPEAKPLHAKSS